jgi:hypothetical protein
MREQAAGAAVEGAFRLDAADLAETAQKERERRQTQERLRHLFSQAFIDEDECRLMLQTCADACAEKGIDFAALLQEPIMFGQLPVYWAIVKSHVAVQQPQGVDVVILTILDFSRPLQNASVDAVCRACVAVSDNALFQRLCRLYKLSAPPSSGVDESLEGSGPEDSIVVQELHGNDGAFTVYIKLAQFLLRMRYRLRFCPGPVFRCPAFGPCFSHFITCRPDMVPDFVEYLLDVPCGEGRPRSAAS